MAKPQPLVSVIIPSYKMGAYIGEALQSVGAQSYRRWEVVVVDDCGPDDGTYEVIKAFRTSFPDHRVECVRHPTNRGVSAARNTAIAAAEGEFLAFLDPDDSWFPDHLSNCMGAFSRDAGVAVVTGPVEIFGNKDAGQVWPDWQAQGWRREYFPESLSIQNFIQICATVARRSAVAEVGGFDVTPALQHIEDYDLWIRLADRGYRFVFLDEKTARYRRHDAAATANPEVGRLLNHELCARHVGFFIRMHGKFVRDMYEEVQSLNLEVTRLKSAFRNPLLWLVERRKQRLTAKLSSPQSRTSGRAE